MGSSMRPPRRRRRRPPLSPAELRLLPYLQTHLTIREIAERLYVSRNTVSSQVSSIYRKLAVTSRSEAVQQASTVGLLGGWISFTRAGEGEGARIHLIWMMRRERLACSIVYAVPEHRSGCGGRRLLSEGLDVLAPSESAQTIETMERILR